MSFQLLILILVIKFLYVTSFNFLILNKSPPKFLNIVRKITRNAQLNFEYFKFNQTMALEHLKLIKDEKLEYQKLINEEKSRNETLAMEYQKLINEEKSRIETLAMEHLKLIKDEKIRKETLALDKIAKFTNIILLVLLFYAVNCFLQFGIFIRDGLLGKKSEELAINTARSLIFSQVIQTATIFLNWTGNLLRKMGLLGPKFG